MFQYHPSNPFRPTDWRWQWARVMREKKVRTAAKKNIDDFVLRAFKLQLKLAKCKDDVDRWAVMESFPDIYSAYLIYRRGDDEDRHPLRYAIEARLLAGQQEHEIAELLGITSDTIRCYERVFFNVKEKLRFSDYVMTCILGPSVHAGLSDRDYDLLWKLFGFLYGPTVLDAFISTTSRRFRPESLNEVDAALADDARSALQRKVAIVARAFTINPFSQSELLNIYARFLEVEKDSNTGKAQDVILQNIQVMLNNLPWQAGEEPLEASKQIEQYDTGAEELRTNELLAVSVGKQLPAHSELKFPESIHKKDGGTDAKPAD